MRETGHKEFRKSIGNIHVVTVFTIAFISSFLPGCNSDKSSQAGKPYDSVTVTDSLPDTLRSGPSRFINDERELSNGYSNVIRPLVFSPKAHIYSGAYDSSRVLATLKFGDTVNITDLNLENGCWYQVDWKGRKAFIRDSDIASHSFISPTNKQVKYFVVTSRGPERYYSAIYKYDISKRRFLDTFDIGDFPASTIRQIDNSRWLNSEGLFVVSHDGACCGCSNDQIYILDAANLIQQIFRCTQYVDDGGEGGAETNLYLPHDPLKDTIVFHDYAYSSDAFELGDTSNKDRNERVDKDIRTYYRWDGYKLVRLK